MKVYKEVFFKSKLLSNEKVIEIFQQFTLTKSYWIFMNKESEDYTQSLDFPSCVIILNHKEFPVEFGFAITHYRNNMYYLANIVPSSGSITIPEYNLLLDKFAEEFRLFIKNNKIKISMTVSPDNIGLNELISSPKVRLFFERYLHCYPNIRHPSDIKRLDQFICAASRYCRKNIDFELLQRYLMEDLYWSSKDTKWCCNRIKTGMDILKISKSFHDF